ncbi:MAG: type II toxin-antitoxin system prevent-host-death family antitoxin [Desulfobacterales bacterium]|nr:type II toxin-antitoxin system prevent-host-death family antitoxin [Desulfobacterales bacterium]
MKTVTAADANRQFSKLLRDVSQGAEKTILSRGTPVAKITSVRAVAGCRRNMKGLLLSRLKAQSVTGSRNWTRDELYGDEACG